MSGDTSSFGAMEDFDIYTPLPSLFDGEYLDNRLDNYADLPWIEDFEEFKRMSGICRSKETDLYRAVRQNGVPLVENC